MPPTLAVRFFLLAAHGEYIQCDQPKSKKEDQKAFLKSSIDPEKTVMRTADACIFPRKYRCMDRGPSAEHGNRLCHERYKGQMEIG